MFDINDAWCNHEVRTKVTLYITNHSSHPLRSNNEANRPFFQYDQTLPKKNGYPQILISESWKRATLLLFWATHERKGHKRYMLICFLIFFLFVFLSCWCDLQQQQQQSHLIKFLCSWNVARHCTSLALRYRPKRNKLSQIGTHNFAWKHITI